MLSMLPRLCSLLRSSESVLEAHPAALKGLATVILDVVFSTAATDDRRSSAAAPDC
jgi:hypothetical protein